MQRKRLAALATATLAAGGLALPFTAPQVNAAPASTTVTKAAAPDRDDHDHPGSDNLLRPWQKKYEALRRAGVEQRLRTGGAGGTERLARGQFAKVAQTGQDRIFVIIAEFGDTRHSAYCDSTDEGACAFPSDGTPQTYDGPEHNEIPQPDRSVDNSTLWKPDYNSDHYRHLYFNRMRKFYENQSSGKYSFNGDVTEWVKVPFNEARYGRDFCGDIVCNNTWFLLRDGLAQWTQDRLDEGMTIEEIRDYLKTFDIQDRYDFDQDGNFREPDGYIDHMQIVHAGGDQADGDPTYGSDAIWSHRWYAQIHPQGDSGPAGGGQFGGIDVGEGGPSDGGAVQIPHNPTGVWVGDYTIQPENGGLSVFAHEYGHDLGLPDHYDLSGNTGGAENSVGWWSLMSQSRGTLPRDAGIGDRPMPFGAWDKFQLGWLDNATVRFGKSRTIKVRPSQKAHGAKPNGIVVKLPDKKVRQELGAPCDTCGEQYFYSDQGNDLDNSMTRTVAGGGALTAKVRYEIEDGWDYAFLEASSDGGATWDSVDNSENYDGDDQSGLDPDNTGISGNSGGEWVDLTATVPPGTNALRWRYVTDGAVVLSGFQVDNVTLGGVEIGNAETDEGWTFDGFRRTTGSELIPYLNAYLVENRTHKGRDKPLSHLYNFGFTNTKPDRVEFFENNPGALINYWDASYTDNNVGEHPGHGLILPVDAHPQFVHTPDGSLARPRINAWDATFNVEPSKKQVLHFGGEKYTLPARKAKPRFNDRRRYWSDSDRHGAGEHFGHYQPGWYSVEVPRTGTTIKVLKVTKKGVLVIKVN